MDREHPTPLVLQRLWELYDAAATHANGPAWDTTRTLRRLKFRTVEAAFKNVEFALRGSHRQYD